MDDDTSESSCGDPSCDPVSGCCSSDTDELRKTVLRSHVMVVAYAASLVILSLGFVVLIITLAVLCFKQPDKANAFLLLLGGPVVGVLLSHSLELKKIWQNGNDRIEHKRK